MIDWLMLEIDWSLIQMIIYIYLTLFIRVSFLIKCGVVMNYDIILKDNLLYMMILFIKKNISFDSGEDGWMFSDDSGWNLNTITLSIV